MEYLVIYDNTGRIYYQAMGVKEPVGLNFIKVIIPDGMMLEEIDITVEPHKPIFKPIPKSQVALLSEQITALNIALAEIMGV